MLTYGPIPTYTPYQLFDADGTPQETDRVGDWTRISSTNPKTMLGAFGTWDGASIGFETSLTNDSGQSAGGTTVMPVLNPSGNPVAMTSNTLLEVNLADYLWVRAVLTSDGLTTSLNAFIG